MQFIKSAGLENFISISARRDRANRRFLRMPISVAALSDGHRQLWAPSPLLLQVFI